MMRLWCPRQYSSGTNCLMTPSLLDTRLQWKCFVLLIPDHDGQKQIVYKRWFWNEDSQVGWDNTPGTQILGHKKKNRSAAQGRGYSRAELANKPNWSQLGVLLACPGVCRLSETRPMGPKSWLGRCQRCHGLRGKTGLTLKAEAITDKQVAENQNKQQNKKQLKISCNARGWGNFGQKI